MVQTVKKHTNDVCGIVEWRVTPPLEFVTVELIYFLNNDTDSGSNHVSGSQALANMALCSVQGFRGSMWRWEPCVQKHFGTAVRQAS